MKRWSWLSLNLFLLVMFALGLVLFWLNFPSSPPVEIILPSPSPAPVNEIHIEGEVGLPGIYPYQPGESLGELIQAAGGLLPQASGRLKLYVPKAGEESSPQKIDINRADAWLLKALPGVGPQLAQAIIDYRNKNGPFRSTTELLKVPGIGPGLYERIKELITVGD